jgi:hypothetical protein
MAETLRPYGDLIGIHVQYKLTQSDMHLSNQGVQNRWELEIPVHAMLSSH